MTGPGCDGCFGLLGIFARVAVLCVPPALIVLPACGLDRTAGGFGEGEGASEGSESGAGTAGDHEADIEGAIDDLQLIVDGAVAFFEIENPDGEDGLLHHCPHPGGAPAGGRAGITPELEFDCNEGPEQLCWPSQDAGVGLYDSELWTQNPVWAGVGFAKDDGHAFHYDFIAVNDWEGYGACSFTAQAFADLDDDAIFSTYERRGTIDEDGALIDEQLHVELPYE